MVKDRPPDTECCVLLLTPSQDLMNNSPNCLAYNSYRVSAENLVWDQLLIPMLMFLFILVTCLFDIVLILVLKEKFYLGHS